MFRKLEFHIIKYTIIAVNVFGMITLPQKKLSGTLMKVCIAFDFKYFLRPHL